MFHRFDIGGAEAVILSDGSLTLAPPAEVFAALPADVLHQAIREAGLPEDRLVVEQNCLYVALGGQRLLFDCGLGAARLYGEDSGRLLASMAEAGIDPASITALILTHAHTDHCWGLLGDDGTPNFPNATIYIGRAELAFWEADPRASPRSRAWVLKHLSPMKDRLVLLEDGDTVVPGVTAQATPGHTPGHLSFMLRSEGMTVCVVGDAIFHDVFSYRFPGVSTPFDLDAAVSTVTRRALLADLAAAGCLAVSYHAAWPGLGRVAASGTAYRFVPA